MTQTYGIELPHGHTHRPLREPVRYVIIIDAGGASVARLMLDTHRQVAEFDGGASEVVQMTQGITPTKGANGPEWDVALQGHSTEERMAADVYTLDV